MVVVNKTRKFTVIAAPDHKNTVQGDLAAKRTAYESIFEDIEYLDAARESRAEREAIGKVKDVTLTYGEVRFDGIIRAFDVIKNDGGMQSRGSFCDLGSGSGHGCIIAALYHNFEVCYGIELVHCLYDMSMVAKRRWEAMFYFSTTSIQFYQDTFLDLSVCDWTKCDVVFANSTCFTVSLIHDIAELARVMSIGSYFITFTTMLPETSGFRVIAELREEMSWGMADIFIHKKTF